MDDQEESRIFPRKEPGIVVKVDYCIQWTSMLAHDKRKPIDSTDELPRNFHTKLIPPSKDGAFADSNRMNAF